MVYSKSAYGARYSTSGCGTGGGDGCGRSGYGGTVGGGGGAGGERCWVVKFERLRAAAAEIVFQSS
jgi:hypothetical protein